MNYKTIIATMIMVLTAIASVSAVDAIRIQGVGSSWMPFVGNWNGVATYTGSTGQAGYSRYGNTAYTGFSGYTSSGRAYGAAVSYDITGSQGNQQYTVNNVGFNSGVGSGYVTRQTMGGYGGTIHVGTGTGTPFTQYRQTYYRSPYYGQNFVRYNY